MSLILDVITGGID